jgi:hypothetical protein
MSAKQAPRPMALCEICFLEDHTRWEPESMDEEGRVLMKLVGVDVPEKINTESVEICCMCGAITVSGIFEMMCPSDVYFNAESEKENVFEFALEDFDEEEY